MGQTGWNVFYEIFSYGDARVLAGCRNNVYRLGLELNVRIKTVHQEVGIL